VLVGLYIRIQLVSYFLTHFSFSINICRGIDRVVGRVVVGWYWVVLGGVGRVVVGWYWVVLVG